MARRLALLASVVLFTTVAVELIALVALVVTRVYPRGSFGEIYASTACLKADEFNYGKNAQSRQGMEVMLGKIPHPFFGIVVNPEGEDLAWRRQTVGANYENELRYAVSLGRDPRTPDIFTIGIFGASVAVSFAEHIRADERFATALRERVPSLRDRKIVIRNMAIGSSRQPAQLAIATQYMELFDMTINLDGYSEQAITMYPDYPIEFPMFGDVFFSENGPSTYLSHRALAQACTLISRPGELPLVRHSNAYFLFWYVASAYFKQSLAERQPEAGVSENLSFTDDEVRRLYAAYYERYTRYQHQILTANGVRAYFFLQPNQYVPDSKPFSEEERRTALNMADSAETASRYALLREKIRELASQGVRAFDLTGVFSRVEDTVYVDSCCHVNDRGNQLLADAIVDVVAREENAGSR